ncbi:MAG: hypothetical protein JNM57_08540 [Cyclobacteriaceae bacterium]|nr:hypothetical protein [Cyclobacteriaceae bacterium]
MKRSVQIVVIVLALFCIYGSGELQYTLSIVSSEQTDDFRETEILHLLSVQKKTLKSAFHIYTKVFLEPRALNHVQPLSGSVQGLPKSLLYLQLRVLRI